MVDQISIDTSELRALSVDLGRAAARAIPEVTAVISKGALNVKTEMVEDAQASSFSQIAPTITYDVTTRMGSIEGEVGPDRDRGGAAGLAGAYLGWPNGGGGSLSLDAPLEHEEPRMLKALDDLLGGLL